MARYARSGINKLTYKTIAAGIEVHRHMGPGLFESVYQRCMAVELATTSLPFQIEPERPIVYKGTTIACGFKPDFFIDGLLIVEIKSVQELAPVHYAQLLTYLKLTGAPIGLLMNFNVTVLRQGIKRLLNSEHEIFDDTVQLSRASHAQSRTGAEGDRECAGG